MIIDLKKFIAAEQPHWTELEKQLDHLDQTAPARLSLEQLRRFHYLYERASAGLAKLAPYSDQPETRRYLENLVARAYGEIHEAPQHPARILPFTWFFQTLPRTFRRHRNAFWLSLAITLLGALFGGVAITFDPEAKAAIVPAQFAHLMEDPAERVARDEQASLQANPNDLMSFSAQLMTNNIKVSLTALAFGILYGVGTILILFYNGIILGVVTVDYVAAGQGVFLAGWLLPHGSIEIPAILMGGQAGLVLAAALIGQGHRRTLAERLRAISGDLVTLIAGLALLLVWAGLVEAFFSQVHAPILPYSIKIAFGVAELVLLTLFFWKSGGAATPSTASHT